VRSAIRLVIGSRREFRPWSYSHRYRRLLGEVVVAQFFGKAGKTSSLELSGHENRAYVICCSSNSGSYTETPVTPSRLNRPERSGDVGRKGLGDNNFTATDAARNQASYALTITGVT